MSVSQLAILPLVLVFFLLSLVKTLLRSLTRLQLRRLADAASPRVKRLLEQSLADPTELILPIQILIQVSLVAIAVLVTSEVAELGGSAPALVSFLALSAFVLVFEHFFPRYVLSVDRERLLVQLLPVYTLIEPLALALAWPMAKLYRAVFRRAPGTSSDGEPSAEEVRAFIDVGEEAGILDALEGEMVESLVDFGETLVREAMTPRVAVVSIEGSRTLADLRNLAIESRHSRIPVFRERPDNIEGIVHVQDLLEGWRDGREADPVAKWMKPTVYVPETKLVSSLLKEFQRNRVGFAVVVDEFGGTAGIVTLQDLLEEIVGDIKDEHDAVAVEIVRQEDGSFLASGKIEVEKLEETFGLELGDADFETLAGLVFATLGRVPAAGESFVEHGLRFQVVDADRHRVNQVRITPLASASSAGA